MFGRMDIREKPCLQPCCSPHNLHNIYGTRVRRQGRKGQRDRPPAHAVAFTSLLALDSWLHSWPQLHYKIFILVATLLKAFLHHLSLTYFTHSLWKNNFLYHSTRTCLYEGFSLIEHVTLTLMEPQNAGQTWETAASHVKMLNDTLYQRTQSMKWGWNFYWCARKHCRQALVLVSFLVCSLCQVNLHVASTSALT